MGVDDLRQLEAGIRLLLEVGEHPKIMISQIIIPTHDQIPYSDGFAGSMMTASFVLSSETK